MKIILLKSIEKLGKKNDIKNVKPGYARNFLIPKKLAILANEKALIAIEMRKKALKAKMKIEKDKMLKTIKKLNGLVLNISIKTGEKGRLFASLYDGDIINKLKKKGFKGILDGHLKLSEVIKKTGKYSGVIDMGFKKKASISINVKSKKSKK